MALGDDGDFRMVGFGQVLRFPPQDIIGGSGSIQGREFTTPFGGNLQQPGSAPTQSLYNGDLINQSINNTLNNTNNNYFNNITNVTLGGGGTGGGTATKITVVDSTGSPSVQYTDIDELNFFGAGVSLYNPPGTPNSVEVTITGSGGGGSTIVYGEITGASRITTGVAKWSYSVTLYGGSSVTAYNLYERGNTTTSAYGYTISPASSDRISSTNYSISPVPNGVWVSLEQTSGVTGTTSYWFGAPNVISGTC